MMFAQNYNDALKAFYAIEEPTWNDLINAINNAKFPLGCGYIGFGCESENERLIKIKGTVVAYWVRGGSEGYWVHVQEMNLKSKEDRENAKSKYEISSIILLVKVLNENEREIASEVVDFILKACENHNMW